MRPADIPRPTTGDVVDRIIEDHRLFEELLRIMRDVTADREQARAAMAELLIAHDESEESTVYPKLRRKDAITGEEVEHGAGEHAEANAALLALLEVGDSRGEEFDEAVEDLATALNHHLGEEEQTILNPARTDVPDETRASLGATWLEARNRLLDQGCGDIETVRGIVERAEKDDLLG